MATILKLRVRAAEKPTKGEQRAPSSAEIVIFPGVRYQRWPEEQVQRRSKETKVSRDTLTVGE